MLCEGGVLAVFRLSPVGLTLLVVGAAFTLLTPTFLTLSNLLNVCTSASVVAIVGLGMTLAIVSGNFDLSVGSNAAFAGCITMILVPQSGVMAADALGIVRGGAICCGTGRLRASAPDAGFHV